MMNIQSNDYIKAAELLKELEELACDYFFNQNGYDTADYYDFEFVD